MPELPEVERAAALIREHAVGKRIHNIDTFEDRLVFSGSTHEDFAREITGRVVENAARYGKPSISVAYVADKIYTNLSNR
ncbi:hypothetical protein ID866_391 [Astraeus odoratus]|nr:hypothetical protein ID866_391 [Astraeus odoratus]